MLNYSELYIKAIFTRGLLFTEYRLVTSLA